MILFNDTLHVVTFSFPWPNGVIIHIS